MITTPKSLRLQIGIFGRTNVGKSSFLNMIADQDVAITSPIPGTTTDVVEKPMELLPIGPVVFIDTAGIDDATELGAKRLEKTHAVFNRADCIVLVVEPDIFGEFEQSVSETAANLKLPLIVAVNKIDIRTPSEEFMETIRTVTKEILLCSALDATQRRLYKEGFRSLLISSIPDDFINPAALLSDLVPAGGHAVFIVPIDLQAPKGRLILPQVQSIRDILDADASVTVTKEREFLSLLDNLKRPPDLVICDSQVVNKMVADTPDSIKCTTFSTLFARFKGDLTELVRGVKALDTITAGDKILIAEACTHHSLEDDIGTVKIPRWLRQYLGFDVRIDHVSGRDYPSNIHEYSLIIHCGSCMLNRREMLYRISKAKEAGIPITNYGLCISFVQGVLKRILSPFPGALSAFTNDFNQGEIL